MRPLHDFFGIVAGSAATLLGLLFVSVSLNAETILGNQHGHAMHLAEQAFHNYLAALVVALVGFFPGITPQSFGYPVLSLSMIYAIWLLLRFYQAMIRQLTVQTRVRAIRRYGATFLGYAALILGGFQFLDGSDGKTAIALGSLLLLVSATTVSWDLLIKIAADRHAAQKS